MAERAYLSIGEVLSLLKEEFADITISKIRFLESQGLIDPERTPSGYRKFYDADVERLRWILQQQRENFLPLKVIKGRLGVGGASDASESSTESLAPPDPAPSPTPSQAPSPAPSPKQPPSSERAPRPAVPSSAPAPVARPAPGPDPGQPEPARRPPPPPPPPPRDRPAGPSTPPLRRPERSPVAAPSRAGGNGTNYTIEELASACGLAADQLTELERYGMLAGRMVGGVRYYDDQALLIAELAAGFLRFGVEARHLRMYKNAAEREAGFFEQIVMPMLKQRNPEARRQAVETLNQLSDLGEHLRGAMLREALREYTSGL